MICCCSLAGTKACENCRNNIGSIFTKPIMIDIHPDGRTFSKEATDRFDRCIEIMSKVNFDDLIKNKVKIGDDNANI